MFQPSLGRLSVYPLVISRAYDKQFARAERERASHRYKHTMRVYIYGASALALEASFSLNQVHTKIVLAEWSM